MAVPYPLLPSFSHHLHHFKVRRSSPKQPPLLIPAFPSSISPINSTSPKFNLNQINHHNLTIPAIPCSTIINPHGLTITTNQKPIPPPQNQPNPSINSPQPSWPLTVSNPLAAPHSTINHTCNSNPIQHNITEPEP